MRARSTHPRSAAVSRMPSEQGWESVFQEAIDKAIAVAVRSRRVRREGGFLWRADMKQLFLSDRSPLPAAYKKLELIPPEEIALAVHRAVSGAYGIGTEEAIAAAGRVLGFGRITAETRAGIELVIRKMVQSGELQDQGGQLMSRIRPDG